MDSIRGFSDENVKIVLVGNKSDAPTLSTAHRQVTYAQALKFSIDNDLIFIGESSAQNNINVKEVMDALFEGNKCCSNSLGINLVQSELVEKGLKKVETLRISEEE